MSAAEITNQARTDTVLRSCDVAFDQAKQAWRRGDTIQVIDLWISIQKACADELKDVAAAAKAGVP